MFTTEERQCKLELFKWLRGNTYELIKSLPAEVWGNTLYHPEVGMMTMDDWLDTYERHIPDHITQMQTVYEAWQVGQLECKARNVRVHVICPRQPANRSVR